MQRNFCSVLPLLRSISASYRKIVNECQQHQQQQHQQKLHENYLKTPPPSITERSTFDLPNGRCNAMIGENDLLKTIKCLHAPRVTCKRRLFPPGGEMVRVGRVHIGEGPDPRVWVGTAWQPRDGPAALAACSHQVTGRRHRRRMAAAVGFTEEGAPTSL